MEEAKAQLINIILPVGKDGAQYKSLLCWFPGTGGQRQNHTDKEVESSVTRRRANKFHHTVVQNTVARY